MHRVGDAIGVVDVSRRMRLARNRALREKIFVQRFVHHSA